MKSVSKSCKLYTYEAFFVNRDTPGSTTFFEIKLSTIEKKNLSKAEIQNGPCNKKNK